MIYYKRNLEDFDACGHYDNDENLFIYFSMMLYIYFIRAILFMYLIEAEALNFVQL